MRVREGECSACGVCARVCPTGAISGESENRKHYRLHFDGSACTNCGLCHEACPLIEFDEHFDLADIAGGASRIVAKVALSSSVVCEEVIPTVRGEACPTCEKRQFGPAHQSKSSKGKTEDSREVAVRRVPRASEVVP